MQTRVYQLVTTASQAMAVTRQIIAPGYICCVGWAAYLNSPADDSNMLAELSFQGAIQIVVDNAQGVIDGITLYQNVLTSGIGVACVNKSLSGLYVPVGVGQMLYLNTTITGAASIRCWFHVMER